MGTTNIHIWRRAMVGVAGVLALAGLTAYVTAELGSVADERLADRAEEAAELHATVSAVHVDFARHERNRASIRLDEPLDITSPEVTAAYQGRLALQRAVAGLSAQVEGGRFEELTAPTLGAIDAYFDAGDAFVEVADTGEMATPGDEAGMDRISRIDQRSDEVFDAIGTLEAELAAADLAAVRAAEGRYLDLRRATAVAGWGMAAIVLALTLVTVRRSAREERIRARVDAAHRAETARTEFEMQVRAGLEMSANEDDAFRVLRRSLSELPAATRVDLLVADSSRTHYQRPVSRPGADGLEGCGVSSPGECPAARRGHRIEFPDSTAVDACPFLAARDEPCAAVCVPLSMAGATAGVLHAVTPVASPIDHDGLATLDTVARAAGDRIGVLRAFAQSETQAAVDPLTGLLNRRSFENRARTHIERARPFTVCFADLDHFKDLNDKHGHDTGDRALRLFGRILNEETRPGDLVARYGGEEFVLMLPDCSSTDVGAVLTRIRNRLASDTGGHGLPAFTVSVGIAEWDGVADLTEVVSRADRALLEAKDAGRDRDRIFEPMWGTDPGARTGSGPEPEPESVTR